ncbi:Pyridoxine/pyridoxamine 5'-phosphate oxidase [Frankliniella fusca]|uniref:Pyridoxine/pyridoxamine 5'-phosphate oxidase n=1 Tax=Frankliniella fusca TaxID=407009 RepID=A0AAE1I1B9_9NEOP|nr:Pyridoxine/pyridoxamine 5'-phosphate oxidase [Frankliniella fusca]
MAGLPVNIFQGRSENFMIFHGNDGWHYNLREQRPARLRLQCRHYKGGCRATASVDLASETLSHGQPHNHHPDMLLEEDMDLRRHIIHVVKTDIYGTKLRTILNQIKFQQSPELSSRFRRVRMQSAMYEARASNYPCIPESLIQLGVLLGMPNTRRLCETVDKQDYIFQGIVGDAQNKTIALVFVSGRMLQFLGTVTNIHGDGTFKKRSRKPKMAQIFNLTTNHGGYVVPVVRVLMLRRHEEAYVCVLSFLKLLVPNWAPERVHCDFERAQMNAFKRVLPMSRIVGCLWHYGAASSLKASKLGLAPIAEENDEVKTFIRCIAGLPLLPPDRIWTGLLDIWAEVEEAGWADTLWPFFKYFESEWKPRIQELSVFESPERTNNIAESDNGSLASVIPQNRPNIWHLIGAFVKLEHLAYSDKLAIDRGDAVTASKKWRAKLNDKRVKRLTGLLNNGQITVSRFLHESFYVILAAVHYGLHVRNENDSDSDSDHD